ncbi:tetratricopeptide repeat protein [Actinoplanes utahensis]|uniref:Uncharacterized protein n=1 Tax=Actinoplanes utahensis TaxID=1869 RepID=A0A0A6UHI9_ACTUT|nr:hypothetical protein [Actinoplanes utahensis]KHD74563.1 hypothetical protein MB27_28020 [Actinoplanes utahensis]GIF35393.1 hypothetical protein Aut01nite_83790 [Actinoplanes utahensis]
MKLADLYVQQGKVEEAIEEYDDLIENGSGDYPDEASRSLAGLLVETGRGEELREWMVQADTHGYGVPRMYYAEFLSEEGRVDELRDLATSGDSFPEVMWFAKLLSRLGRIEELRKLTERDPSAARMELYRALAEAGAVEELKALTHQNKSRQDAHQCLLELLARQGREEEIRRMAHGGDHEARKMLIRLLAREGRNAEIAEMAAAGDPAACRHQRDRLRWILD